MLSRTTAPLVTFAHPLLEADRRSVVPHELCLIERSLSNRKGLLCHASDLTELEQAMAQDQGWTNGLRNSEAELPPSKDQK